MNYQSDINMISNKERYANNLKNHIKINALKESGGLFLTAFYQK